VSIGVRRVINDRFVEVPEGFEVFEVMIAAVAGGIERFHDGGPVGGAVEEEGKALKLELWTFFEYSLSVMFS